MLERQGARAGRWSLPLDLHHRLDLVRHHAGHHDILAAPPLVWLEVHPLVPRCPGRPPASAVAGKDFRDLAPEDALSENHRRPRGNSCPGSPEEVLRSEPSRDVRKSTVVGIDRNARSTRRCPHQSPYIPETLGASLRTLVPHRPIPKMVGTSFLLTGFNNCRRLSGSVPSIVIGSRVLASRVWHCYRLPGVLLSPEALGPPKEGACL